MRKKRNSARISDLPVNAANPMRVYEIERLEAYASRHNLEIEWGNGTYVFAVDKDGRAYAYYIRQKGQRP